MTLSHDTTSPETLGFRRPVGIPLGPLLALAISGGLAFWMSTAPAASPEHSMKPAAAEPSAQSVRVIASESYEMTRLIPADGETRALREGRLSARVAGIVETLHAAKGDKVSAGDPLLTLLVPDFTARQTAAEAQLAEARRTLEKSTQLNAKGLVTEDALQSARTSLAAAEATWATIEEERADLTVRAPFGGTISLLDVEVGESVSKGDALATLMDLTSLIVDIQVPQGEIGQLRQGQVATATPIGGEVHEGQVGFIAPAADSATRSFPVEIVVPNPDGRIRAGMSTSVSIPGDSFEVHDVPSAYLSLSSEGDLLVKTVEDDQVRAWPVEIVSSGVETLQVSGLPKSAKIITVGQGFVRPGDKVSVKEVQ